MTKATQQKKAAKKTSAKRGHAAARTRKAKGDGKLSAIDAAAKVLAETGRAMSAKELIEAMAAKGYWTSPNGLTPHATLFAAISREVRTKGKNSRFAKPERGKFTLKA
jgi:hypothetical protein